MCPDVTAGYVGNGSSSKSLNFGAGIVSGWNPRGHCSTVSIKTKPNQTYVQLQTRDSQFEVAQMKKSFKF